MAFDADNDNETLPPGVVSQEAVLRKLEVTGTEPTERAVAKQSDIRKHAFLDADHPSKPRTKWTRAEVSRMATVDQWSYANRHGHMDVGTVCAVGNLLLRGLSPSATRKALGITLNTWNTWYANGTGDDTGTRPSMIADDMHTDTHISTAQAPYDVFAFVVDHSQAVMELRAIKGWVGHFDRDWRASQAFLQARNPDEWNPTNKTTIDTTIKSDVQVTQHHDANDLQAIASILLKAGAIPKPVETVEVESVEVLRPEISDRSESTGTEDGAQ